MLLRPSLVYLLALAVFPFADSQAAQLILNEALYNEPGSATSGEWVELLCWPDTGGAGCSLAGYRFVDGNDTT